jgi:hypothetical protein
MARIGSGHAASGEAAMEQYVALDVSLKEMVLSALTPNLTTRTAG